MEVSVEGHNFTDAMTTLSIVNVAFAQVPRNSELQRSVHDKCTAADERECALPSAARRPAAAELGSQAASRAGPPTTGSRKSSRGSGIRAHPSHRASRVTE